MDNDQVVIEGINYQLNHDDFTATVSNVYQIKEKLFIPRSIIYDSHEYIITKIKKRSFYYNNNIKSVIFAADSEILSLSDNGLSSNSLTSITLPASIEKVEVSDSIYMTLIEIKVAPGSKNFISIYNNTILVGKSDLKSDNFDSIFIASKSIEKVLIPNFIKYIKSYSFYNCSKLKRIDFTSDSNLLMIEKKAFLSSSIEFISIPKNADLKEGWCSNTAELKTVFLSPDNSNFCYLDKEKKIIIGKLNDFEFNKIVFASRDIEKVEIPNHIKRICNCAFEFCCKLREVEINENSQLQSIGKWAFFDCPLMQRIFIPRHVKIIDKHAFDSNEDLQDYVFDENSELEIIGNFAFTKTALYEITIPKHVKKIGKFVFLECELLENVFFEDDCEVESFDDYAFASSKLNEILIPKSVKSIGEYCFGECDKLQKIEFEENSQLESIGNAAFSLTAITEITIPKHVKILSSYIFSLCRKLENVYFEKGSEVHSIGKSAFKRTSIYELDFPDNLSYLQEGWCNGISELGRIIVSSKNSNFITLNNELIIGKKDKDSDLYDTIFFIDRYATSIKIPSFIKYFNSFAFSNAIDLSTIEFSEDSHLLSIGKSAFKFSGLETLNIPNSVYQLANGWCNQTEYLNNVSISPENKNFIHLPGQEKIILGKSDNEQDYFDVIVFACRNIKNAVIPNYIKYISPYAFASCNLLNKIDFLYDSKLQFVGDGCFMESNITNIVLPKNVEFIGSSAFSSGNLELFEALSESFTFDSKIFMNAKNLRIISLPNAKRVHETEYYMPRCNFILFVCSNAIVG